MTQDHRFIVWLKKKMACGEARAWAMKQASPQAAWNRCEEIGWLKWVLANMYDDDDSGADFGHILTEKCWCMMTTCEEIKARWPRIPWPGRPTARRLSRTAKLPGQPNQPRRGNRAGAKVGSV